MSGHLRIVLAFVVALSACSDEPTSKVLQAAPPLPPPIPDAAPPPPVEVPTGETRLFLDLVEHADRAHISRNGPMLGPFLPGWKRVSQLAGRGPWLRPRKGRDHPAEASLDSIGGTLWFPVAEGEADLRYVHIWLRPVQRGQLVSIFVDEQPVTTMRLRPGGRFYTLRLPVDGLTPGEHSLRFWFRFTRWRGKVRTPGGLGPVAFTRDEAAPEWPEAWSGQLEVAGLTGPALLAGPTTTWNYYLLGPEGGRLSARAGVKEGDPVKFSVRAETDRDEPVTLWSETVQPGALVDLDLDLSKYGNQPLRLAFITEGGEGAVGRAGWVEPRIMMPGRARAVLPPARNLLMWVVDGLRADRVGLSRGGDRAHTPNLDMLAAQGGAAIDVWSGGAGAEDGHRRLLRPVDGAPGLAELLQKAGRRTGVLSSSEALTSALQEGFNTRMDLRRAGEPTDTRTLLRELGDWLDVRKKQPFFLYLASADPRLPLTPAKGFQRMYERARPLRGTGPAREAQRKRRDVGAA